MNVFHLRFSLVASVKVSRELLMQTCWWPLSDHWSVQPTSPHLSGFVFYGCLESLTELSALWEMIKKELSAQIVILVTFPLHCNINLINSHFYYPKPVLDTGIVVASVCLSLCLCLCVSITNSSPVQTRITRFGLEVQNTLVKILIVLEVDWCWSLWSNLT